MRWCRWENGKLWFYMYCWLFLELCILQILFFSTDDSSCLQQHFSFVTETWTLDEGLVTAQTDLSLFLPCYAFHWLFFSEMEWMGCLSSKAGLFRQLSKGVSGGVCLQGRGWVSPPSEQKMLPAVAERGPVPLVHLRRLFPLSSSSRTPPAHWLSLTWGPLRICTLSQPDLPLKASRCTAQGAVSHSETALCGTGFLTENE